MKFKMVFILCLISSTTGLKASNTIDQLNSLIVDSVISNHQNKLSEEDLKKIPEELSCIGQESLAKVKIPNLRKLDNMILTNESKTSVVINLTDGDQVAGYLALTSDLIDLNSKKVSTITLKSFSGFWWADGDHYKFSDSLTLCHL
jgi:hypothetical protein